MTSIQGQGFPLEKSQIFLTKIICFNNNKQATSGVDPENEAKLYETLKKTVPCFCSVGHRRELLRWHSHVLVALENGDWELRTTAEHLRQVKE